MSPEAGHIRPESQGLAQETETELPACVSDSTWDSSRNPVLFFQLLSPGLFSTVTEDPKMPTRISQGILFMKTTKKTGSMQLVHWLPLCSICTETASADSRVRHADSGQIRDTGSQKPGEVSWYCRLPPSKPRAGSSHPPLRTADKHPPMGTICQSSAPSCGRHLSCGCQGSYNF